MTTLTLSARLDRTDTNTPWGFRMQGGRDYGNPLVITRVTPGSLAAKCGLQVGDTITKIGDSPTDSILHKDAQQSIVASGNSLELALLRGGSGGLSSAPAPASAQSYNSAPYGAPQQNSSAFSPVKPADQNYNAAPKPFMPGGGSTVPVAVNKQYNTPLPMYSVDNVMDSLATQTGTMNVGQGSSDSVQSNEAKHASESSSVGMTSTDTHAPSPPTTNPSDGKPTILNPKPLPTIRPKFVASGPKPAPLGEKPSFLTTKPVVTMETSKPAVAIETSRPTIAMESSKPAERKEETPRGFAASTGQSRSFKMLQNMVESGEDVTQLNKGRRLSGQGTSSPSPSGTGSSTTSSPPPPSGSPPPLPSQPPPSMGGSPESTDANSNKYVKAIVNNQYNTPVGLYSSSNKQDTFQSQATGILSTLPGVEAVVMSGASERKQIVIPSGGGGGQDGQTVHLAPSYTSEVVSQPAARATIVPPSSYSSNHGNRSTVQESTERHKITIPASSQSQSVGSSDVVQESSERKKIVVPSSSYKVNSGSSYNLSAAVSSGDEPKSYMPSETYRVVQEQDREGGEDRASPFGNTGGSKAQGRSFQMLQKQLNDPNGPPRGGSGPGYKGPGGGSGGSRPAWQPKVPTGERKMKVGHSGDAKRMGQMSGRIPICTTCGIQIRGPFVTALDKTWCPDHFVCGNPHCQQPLIDQGFVEEGNQLFCVRDYEQYFAPRCHKCSTAIIGDRVHAGEKYYHPHCFVCCHCRQPITGGSFHQEQDETYCEKDWAAMFQTKCYGCQFPVEPGDRWVEALNQNWHSECFNCSTCQVNLEGQSFFAKGGKPYCKKHAGGGRN